MYTEAIHGFVGGFFNIKIRDTVCDHNSLRLAGAYCERRGYLMERQTAIKFQKSGQPVWFMGVWSDLPIKARITDIKTENGIEYAYVNCIQDEECDAIGSQGVLFEDLYPSKEALLAAMSEKEQKYIGEIKEKIQTKEDCIIYLYNNHVAAGTEYTDWTARRAIREIALEKWGMELG